MCTFILTVHRFRWFYFLCNWKFNLSPKTIWFACIADTKEKDSRLAGQVIAIYLPSVNARYCVFSRFAACFQQIRTLHGILFNMSIHLPSLRSNRLLRFIYLSKGLLTYTPQFTTNGLLTNHKIRMWNQNWKTQKKSWNDHKLAVFLMSGLNSNTVVLQTVEKNLSRFNFV